MVRLLLRRFAMFLILRNRAFDTIHEALIIAGGSYSVAQRSHLVLVHITSHIVYKYIMAGLANPSSILNGIP